MSISSIARNDQDQGQRRNLANIRTARPDLAIVILAAGAGKRMQSDLPKVLHPVAGRPMLEHVLKTAYALRPHSVYVIYGHGGAQVRSAIKDAPVEWVEQAERLGTGHAVACACPYLKPEQRVLVLFGDTPLIKASTLRELVTKSCTIAPGEENKLPVGLLTVVHEDPTGYGRIIRGADGKVVEIVEEKDCTAEQRTIKECNTGVMVLPAGWLTQWLTNLKNNNAQGEYYLTDVISQAVSDGHAIRTLYAYPEDVMGVNDLDQLAVVEKQYQKRQAAKATA